MLFDNKRLTKFALASISINSAGSKFYFPDQPNLRGKKIQKIAAYHRAIYPRTPDNIPLVQATAFQNSFLIAYVSGREDLKIPLYHLTTQTNLNGNTFFTNNGYIPLFELPIVWEKSYILCSIGYTPVDPQEAWQFGVFYQD
jgi:hypothetical protein